MQFINPDITYRLAQIDDCQIYYEWANDKLVRQNALKSEPIVWENHQKWFYEKLHSTHCVLLIFYIKGKPFGQLRLDIEDKKGKIDYSIAAEYRGKKLAYQMLFIIYQMIQKFKTIHLLTGVVKLNNIASIKSFEKAGFILENKELINNEYCAIFKKKINY